MLSAGDRIAGFEIVTELSSGGMATLFLAKKSGAAGFAKHVALKIVHKHLAEDPHFVDMFLDEARLSARIEHPNCVHVTELGEEAGVYFLAMEYVPGFSLADVLNRLGRNGKRLSPTAAVHIAMQTASGLHVAHELTDDRGDALEVVHRDISPQNILLADKGYVKLIDFGIAKAMGKLSKSVTGSLKGKFRYMSPEQASGASVDRRTDIYALGVVLWEMLTMRRLFVGDNDLAVLKGVQNPDVPPPERYSHEVTPELSAVVLRALHEDPEHRYATARELKLALREALPAAQQLDAADLGALIGGLMTKEAQRRRLSLPSIVAPPAILEKEAHAFVDAMTLPDSRHGQSGPETRPKPVEGRSSLLLALPRQPQSSTYRTPHRSGGMRRAALGLLAAVAAVAGAVVGTWAVSRATSNVGTNTDSVDATEAVPAGTSPTNVVAEAPVEPSLPIEPEAPEPDVAAPPPAPSEARVNEGIDSSFGGEPSEPRPLTRAQRRRRERAAARAQVPLPVARPLPPRASRRHNPDNLVVRDFPSDL